MGTPAQRGNLRISVDSPLRHWRGHVSTIYAWSGDYFCSDCIVYTLTEHEPWRQWLEDEEHDPSAQGTQVTLDLIAQHFTIGHKRNIREDRNFPIRLRRGEWPEGTHFCRTCLKLLTQDANHAT